MAPGPIFLIDTTLFNSFHNCFLAVPFSYFQTLDIFSSQVSASPKDWQPFRKLGQERICVLCAGSTLVDALDNKQASPSLWNPTGLIQLWFFNQGKLPLDCIIPSSWGSQRGVWSSTPSRIFLAPLPGSSSLLQREYHTSTFFLLFCSFLVYFILVLFSLYQK